MFVESLASMARMLELSESTVKKVLYSFGISISVKYADKHFKNFLSNIKSWF